MSNAIRALGGLAAAVTLAFTSLATDVALASAPFATSLAIDVALASAPFATSPANVIPVRQDPVCRYVNESDDPAPIRSGPGKKYPKRAELAPSDEPVRTTCAARGRGAEHWVQFEEGEHKGLWVWRNRLQTWSG